MSESGRGPAQGERGEAGGPRRERALNLPPVVIALCLLLAAIHFVRVQILNDAQDFWLLVRTAFIPILYSQPEAWDGWNLAAPFTYTALHGSVLHLAVNAVWLAAFGSPLANRMGAGRFLLFWTATGVAAAAVHFALRPYDASPLIGASGAVSGMMGAAARFGFQTEAGPEGSRFSGPPMTVAYTLRSRTVLAFLLVWMAVNAVTGLFGAVPGVEGQIAWEAHVGGFLAGFLGVEAFLPKRRRPA